MKKLLIAAAAIAALASPALAATKHPVHRMHGAYAVPAGTVIENGLYAGQDPDPNIQLQLRKEFEQPSD